MLRRRLVALTTTVVAASAAAPASAVAEPSLNLREYCPVVDGHQRYGFQATATGLTPGSIWDLSWNFGGLGGGGADVVGGADANGTLAWSEPQSFDQPVKWITVRMPPVFPQGGTTLTARLKKPCKHADR